MLGGFVAASHTGVVGEFPMMVVWGPLVGVQWLVLKLRCGRERTVAEWVAAERIPAWRDRLLAHSPVVSDAGDLRAGLAADVLALLEPSTTNAGEAVDRVPGRDGRRHRVA
jgi:hypothetical protein